MTPVCLRTALTTVFLISLSAAQASTTNTWQGSTGVWAATTNWSLNHIPLSTEDVVFPTPIPSGGATITVPTGAMANSLTFNDSYTLSGFDLTLTSANGGKINVATGKSVTLATNLSGTAGLTLNTATGSAGTLLLSGGNGYSGTTIISGGTLIDQGFTSALGGSSAIVLGDASTHTFNSSPTLLVDGYQPSVSSRTRPITVANFATTGVYTLGSTGNEVQFTGPITLNQPLTIFQTPSNYYLLVNSNITSGVAGTHIVTFNGNIKANQSSGIIGGGTGALAVVFAGGFVEVYGTNIYTGGTTINSGVVDVENAAALGAATGTVIINGGDLGSSFGNISSLNAYPVQVNGDFNLFDLNLTGTMALGTAAGPSRTIQVDGPCHITGVISNGTAATNPANNLIVDADIDSFLGLEGNNTLTGGVTLLGGSLGIGKQGTSATNSALGTGTFVINGGTIDNSSYGVNIDLSATTKNKLTINGDFNFIGGGNSLNFGAGAVTLGTSAGLTRTISCQGTGTLIIGGAIANGNTAASLTITNDPGAALTLSGNNTFTGGVTLQSGILNISAQGTSTNNSALGTGTFSIAQGATVDNTSAAAINLTATTNNAVILNGDFAFTGTQSLTLGSGAEALGSATGTARTITVSANTLGLGSIANGLTTNSIVKAGPGTLLLAGNSTFQGSASVNAGTLALTGTMASCPAINIGILGTFDIQGVAANPASPGRISDSATITLSGGVLRMEAQSSNNCTETVGSLVFTPGTSNTILLAANGAFTCQLSAGGLLPTLASSTTVNLLREQTTVNTANLYFIGQTTNVAAPISGYTVNGQTALYDATSGTPQGLEQTSGNVFISKAAGAWTTTTTWVNNAAPTASDMVVIRHAVSLGGVRTTQAVVFDQGGGSLAGTAAQTLTNTSGQYTVLVPSVTISAPIAGSSVLKNGTGTLLLSGTNTYTGPTTLNNGILKAGSTQAFGVNSAVTLANVPGVLLDLTSLSSGTLSIGSLTGGGAAGGNVSLGFVEFGIGGDNTSPGPYAGVISDNNNEAPLAKFGTGTLTLTGLNTYTGSTYIVAGVLSTNLLANMNSPSGIGNGYIPGVGEQALYLEGGTLQYTGPTVSMNRSIYLASNTASSISVTVSGTTLTESGTIGISGTTSDNGLTKLGAGTLALTGSNTYTGPTVISAGILSVYIGASGQPSSIGAATNAATNLVMDGGTLSGSGDTDHNFVITAGKTATFDVPSGMTMEFDGAALNTSGNVAKTDTGTLVFTVAQAYTGTTTVNAGTLSIYGNTGAIASSSAININSGATLDINSVGYTEPAAPGRISDSAVVTLNGGTLSMEAGTSANRSETIGSLVFTPGTANTIALTANGNFKCQLIAGGTLPVLSTANVNLFRNVGTGTGTANLLFTGQSANVAGPITGYTVNNQAAKYDATSATPQGLIQNSGNLVVTQAAGNWGTPATWVGNTLPAAGDTVVIHHAVNLEVPYTAQAVMFDSSSAAGSLSGNALTNSSGNFIFLLGGGTVSAPIAGTSLTLTGDGGYLVLTGTNTYSGTTTISAGFTLNVGNNTASGTLGSGPVVNNGELAFFRTDSPVIANNISGSGDVLVQGSGMPILTGNNTYSGGTYIYGAALQVGNGGSAGTLGSGEVSGTGTVTFDRSDSFVYPNAFDTSVSPVSLTQSGTGTTTLSGPLTLGTVTANAGNLVITSGGTVSSIVTTIANTGTLTISGGTSFSPGNPVAVSSTGTLAIESGASFLSAAVTLNNSSNLIVAAGGSLGSSATVSSNATLTVNGTAAAVTLQSSAASTPALAGCLLRGTGSAGDITLADTTNVNACIWPGSAKTVSALAANEQLTVNSIIISTGFTGKFAVVIKNAGGGLSQNLVVNNGVSNIGNAFVLSFATDTTPAVPTSYTILSCTNGIIQDYFTAVDAPPGFVLGTHYDIRYSFSGASPVLQSAKGGNIALPGQYNQIDIVFTGNSVTPVTVDSFAARAEAAGVRLDWHCVSEFQNAGFNLYRRICCPAFRRKDAAIIGALPPKGGTTNEWTRVNPALIAGRITNPDAKTYQFYDWAEPGVYEYKLESVSIQGSHETYRDISGPVVLDGGATLLSPLNGPLTDVRGSGALDAAISSIERARETAQGRSLRAKFAAANSTGVSAVAIDDPRPIKATVQARAIKPGAGGPPAPQLCSTPAPQIAARWFSAKTTSAGSSYTAAKVTYSTPGVLLITQSMLPTGFDMNRVAIQREGRALTALAKTSAGLIVFGEGYSDDYTDKDALFLRSINGATAAGAATQVSGLFASTLPVNTQAPMTASAEFHDVYFDFNLRPYNYPPWFSSQYLTDGTEQSFSISAPNATSGAGSLIVNLWSLTQDHTLQVAVNGQPIGQAQWSGVGQMIQLTFQI
ncbi:MAG TPA: autotransporter-associated beta strand repeat-containing protein, partial [Planctomycetota bacterium]|nr:autotransporter-associated beta strand repeat-containing protein [Planctomycetota bacterium]